MKNSLSELVFILDKSGSMSGLEADTIGGFNSMLQKQQALPGECRITTALFDNNYELLHDRIDIKAVSPLSEKEYWVGGSTALIDAIGRTINKIAAVQKNTAPEYRAENVIFVIITDGMENSSREYSAKKVKTMIEKQKKSGWEFIFLGANIDAVETASNFGISADRAQSFHADSAGVGLNFKVMGNAIAGLRTCGKLSKNWDEEIKEDYKKRDGRK